MKLNFVGFWTSKLSSFSDLFSAPGGLEALLGTSGSDDVTTLWARTLVSWIQVPQAEPRSEGLKPREEVLPLDVGKNISSKDNR